MPKFIDFKSLPPEPPKIIDTLRVGQEFVFFVNFKHRKHVVVKVLKTVITTKDIETGEVYKFNKSGKSTSHKGAFLTMLPKEDIEKLDNSYQSLNDFKERFKN